MSAVFQGDHAGVWKRLSNVLSGRDGYEFVVSSDHKRWNAKALEPGKQIVFGCSPCLAHKPALDGPCLDDACASLPDKTCLHSCDELFVIFRSRQGGFEMNAIVRDNRVGIGLFVSG